MNDALKWLVIALLGVGWLWNRVTMSEMVRVQNQNNKEIIELIVTANGITTSGLAKAFSPSAEDEKSEAQP